MAHAAAGGGGGGPGGDALAHLRSLRLGDEFWIYQFKVTGACLRAGCGAGCQVHLRHQEASTVPPCSGWWQRLFWHHPTQQTHWQNLVVNGRALAGGGGCMAAGRGKAQQQLRGNPLALPVPRAQAPSEGGGEGRPSGAVPASRSRGG